MPAIPTAAGASPAMAQWFAIKADHPDALLFFRMGDFYELFFADAEAAAAALDIALTSRGEHAGAPIAMCGVPVRTAELYLGRLIRRGFRVAVVEQMEDPKTRTGKAPIRREVVRLITPGTITEDALLDAARPNLLLALAQYGAQHGAQHGAHDRAKQHPAIGAAWLDVSTGLFETAALTEPDLQALLGRLDPAEILAPAALPLADWTDRRAPEAIPSPPLVARRRLAEAFGAASLDAFGSFTDAEAIAACLALDYVRASQAGALPRLARPAPQGDAATMAMDAATRASLEILRTREGAEQHTLFAAVNRTLTAAGARTLAAWLSAPLTDTGGDRGAPGRRLLAARQPAQRPLPCAPRCAPRRTSPARSPGCRSAAAGRATSPRCATAWRRRPQVAAALDGPLPATLEAARAALAVDPALHRSLAEALADPPPHRLDDGGAIRPGFDAELDGERALRDDSRKVLAQVQLDYAQRFGVAALKIRHHAQLGYVIEAPAPAVERLRDFPELTLRQGMANGARFTTPELSALDRRITEAAERAAARERVVFAHLVSAALAQSDALAGCAEALARLDVMQSAARLAEGGTWCRPVVERRHRLRDPRRPPSGGRSRPGRRRGLRAEPLRPVARSPRAAADRPQHGGQVDVPAAERADRRAGPGRAAGAGGGGAPRRGGSAVLPRRRRRRPGARPLHLHGRNDRDRRHPAPGRPAFAGRGGRNRPRHRDAGRARHRLGGAGSAARGDPLPHDFRHPFPRACGTGRSPATIAAAYHAGEGMEGLAWSSCTRSPRARPGAVGACTWRSSPACRPRWSSAPRRCWRRWNSTAARWGRPARRCPRCRCSPPSFHRPRRPPRPPRRPTWHPTWHPSRGPRRPPARRPSRQTIPWPRRSRRWIPTA